MQRFEYVKKGELRYVDAPMPVLQCDDDAIVQPVVSATCDLDRAIIMGLTPFKGPFALGHETVAKVLEVGDKVTHVKPGQLVVVPWHVACGNDDHPGADRNPPRIRPSQHRTPVPRPTSGWAHRCGRGHRSGLHRQAARHVHASAAARPCGAVGLRTAGRRHRGGRHRPLRSQCR